MNKENLKLLVNEIENSENIFNWGDGRYCLGSYAKKLMNLDDDFYNHVALSKFLEISETEAFRLYAGRDIDSLFQRIVSFKDTPTEEQRSIAIKYLNELLQK